ncbi:MAG TPA: nitroreductase/quinone reductase family protein [Candidatus Binatia bacterium]|jgi:deazaflavin-dependent oxidoreductase (nitroreductase family)
MAVSATTRIRLSGTVVAWLYAHAHVLLYRLSGGRLGARIRGERDTGDPPVLLLTTRGRRSGKTRTTPLLYLERGDELVVMAANAGNPRHPDWWMNLRAEPHASVQIGGERSTVIASEVAAPEREETWRRYARMYPAVDTYQRATARRIPLVTLRRVNGALQ